MPVHARRACATLLSIASFPALAAVAGFVMDSGRRWLPLV